MNELVKNLIGDKIKYARCLAGISKSQLAERVGLFEEDIIRLENGEYLPELEVFLIILKILNINEDSLSVIDDPIGEESLECRMENNSTF